MRNSLIRSGRRILPYFTIIVLFLFSYCSVPKKVRAEKPVDTTNKQISKQLKKSYQFDDLGLWVSNEFDGARLNNALQVNDSIVMLHFNPENTPINKSPYYAFKTWSKEPREIYFGFNYPEGFAHRYEPKIKNKGVWSIIDSTDQTQIDDTYYMKLNIGPEPQTIASQELNTSEDVQKWYLKNIVSNNSFVHLESAGQSTLGKDLAILDIYYGNPKNKPIVVLLTRQHPPEVTGYFAFQNFLKTIVANTDLSKQFLNDYRVLAIPILNPDGVDLGHWRHNANGVDLNRDWSRYRQPEIRNVVSFIDKLLKKDKSKIILGLDFHSTYEDVFYTNTTREGTGLPNFISDWFSLLEANILDYSVNEEAADSTTPVSKGWFLYGKNTTGITYEIGDRTAKVRIEEIGAVSARAMMEILLKK